MKPTPVVHQDSKIKPALFYREDTPEFIERLGIDAPPPIEKFVLQSDKKYFYGIKKSETMWTYDVKLALAVTRYEADALAFWLGSFGHTVSQVLAPE
jgi:hypothetical protein